MSMSGKKRRRLASDDARRKSVLASPLEVR
jgi:hypothetical protein